MRKIVIELNEVSNETMDFIANKSEATKNIIKKGAGSFKILENYDSEYLEPWSQWITSHTGIGADEHRIKHLGDLSSLKNTQVWDKYAEKFGVIWGCLNARNPKSKKIIFFPDPWTHSSIPSRVYLFPLLKFLKFGVSKRSSPNVIKKITDFLVISPSLLIVGIIALLLIDRKIIKSLFGLGVKKINASVIYCTIEYIFVKFAIFLGGDKNKTDIVFLNMVAHCQHYYWKNKKQYILDFSAERIADIIELASKKYDITILYNGLTQEYSGDKENWHSWVPKGGWQFFVNNFLGIDCNVYPCMSYDSNLDFTSEDKCAKTANFLDSLLINDKKLFYVEINPINLKKLFVRLNFYGEGDFNIFGLHSDFKLKDLFDLAAVRTGRHAQFSMAYGVGCGKFDKTKNRNTESIKLYY